MSLLIKSSPTSFTDLFTMSRCVSVRMIFSSILLVLSYCSTFNCVRADFTYPAEDGPHEATWLQWPHDYGWDPDHVERYEESWVQLAEALHTGERVQIIVYDDGVQLKRVRNLLRKRGLNMNNIDLYEYPTDDVWIRDNGPMFVYNDNDELVVEDWQFNGWGEKADYWFDDYIPRDVSYELDLPLQRVRMVNEGGSIEVDGRGTLMAKRSSILNNNRNPGMTQRQAQRFFRRFLGVTNFIWLDGQKGADITDDHIDGTARFANGDTIVTHRRDDFFDPKEYDILKSATDVNGETYKIVELPLTDKIIPSVGDFGIYINYYVGNDVVIIPSYDDPNDDIAADILQEVYPNKDMVLIDFTELFIDGGSVHCVTKEEPRELTR